VGMRKAEMNHGFVAIIYSLGHPGWCWLYVLYCTIPSSQMLFAFCCETCSGIASVSSPRLYPTCFSLSLSTTQKKGSKGIQDASPLSFLGARRGGIPGSICTLCKNPLRRTYLPGRQVINITVRYSQPPEVAGIGFGTIGTNLQSIGCTTRAFPKTHDSLRPLLSLISEGKHWGGTNHYFGMHSP